MYCFGEAYEVGVWGGERAVCVAGEFVWRAVNQTSEAGANEQWTARKRPIVLAASLLARVPLPLPLPNKIRELKQRRRRRQGERQKRNGFRSAKQQLCTCITLFCTFLCRHCTTTTWKCLISRFVEDGNTRQQLSFSLPELWNSPLEINSKKTCQPVTNWTRWNKHYKVWDSANSLFKWRFRGRRRRCCFSSLIPAGQAGLCMGE